MKRSRTKFFICSGLVAFLLLGQGCGDEKETVPPIVPGTSSLRRGMQFHASMFI
ncbi:unknown [Bacteroides sp. CAG:598]|nr:unknown [Bacteroides sp. CAG:598]